LVNRQQIKEALSPRLQEILDFLPDGWKVTLIARNPADKDQYITLSDDSLSAVRDTIKKAQIENFKV